jgi:hypothetical protein
MRAQFLPLFMTLLLIIGPNTASYVSPKFSIITVCPFSIAASIILIFLSFVILVICKSFVASLFFNHVIPCNCGSIIKDYRSLFVNIQPFSVETLSAGNFWLFHDATVASSANKLQTSKLGVQGIFSLKKKKYLVPLI